MTCKELNPLLDDPAVRAGASLPTEAARHVAECPACRTLLDLLATSPAPEISERVRGKIAASLGRSIPPVRPLRANGTFFVVAAAGFVILSSTAALVLGPRALPAMDWGQIAAVFGVVGAGAIVSIDALRRQMVPGSGVRVPPPALAFAILVPLALSMELFFPWRPSRAFVAEGIPCWLTGLLLAAPSALVFFWLARRGVFLSRSNTGLTVGLLGGLVGASVLQLHCMAFEAGHLAVWHVGIVLTAAAAGFAAGCALSRRRTS